ncbi:hypothetical protein EON82_02215 [bacterium]|nr:MAG: hypothetical protein EON82_02215 [bacterium]
MAKRDWLEDYDPVAEGEQAEDGTDLVGIRYNLSLSVAERIEQHRRAAESIQWLEKLRHAPRSSSPS